MKKITVRDILTPYDLILFSDWVYKAADINCFVEPDLILRPDRYPRATMLCADDEDGPILYLPILSVLMVEMQPNDNETLLVSADHLARSTSRSNVYYLCGDEGADLCIERDYEELVNFRILRREVSTQSSDNGVLILESLAPMPGLSPRKEALALARLGKAIDSIAAQTGHSEVWFLCKDARVADLCKRHGYEEVSTLRLFRSKIDIGISANSQESSEMQIPQNVG